MSFFRNIVAGALRLSGASPSRVELYYLRQNIADGDYELQLMDEEWCRLRLPCCPQCAFGRRYTDLEDKQERRRAREQVLLKRIGGVK